MILIGALALAFALQAPTTQTTAVVAPPMTAAIARRACGSYMMAKREGWSVGKARKKGKTNRAKSKPARPVAKGFGAVSERVPEVDGPAATLSTREKSSADEATASTRLAPADLNANDLAEAAAAAGGDTWRAYADAALAQVVECYHIHSTSLQPFGHRVKPLMLAVALATPRPVCPPDAPISLTACVTRASGPVGCRLPSWRRRPKRRTCQPRYKASK